MLYTDKDNDDEKARLLPDSTSAKRGVVDGRHRRRLDFASWSRWVTTRYREPLDLDGGDLFWYSGEAGKNGGEWIADLFAFPNWSLVCHYFNTGIALNLLATPVTYYLVETKNASAAVTNTYLAMTYMPWCLKIFFGLASDLRPWLGMHRRSYFALGWIVFFSSNVWLAALERPSVAATLLLSFVMVMGCLLSDTVADAMILECTTAAEAKRDTGMMRTHAYFVRQVGSTLGSVLGALVYNSRSDGGDWSWGLSISGCFWLQAFFVAGSIFPLLPFMYELPPRQKLDARALWRSTYDFVSKPGVAVPLFYLYFFNLCYVSNPAWTNFMYEGLGFTDFQVGILYAVGSLMSVFGLKLYEHYFFSSAWRPLYVWTTLAGSLFSLLQILLVTGNTLGVPKIVFATGDASLQEFVQTIIFLPTCIMFFAMIPPGTEGTVYALLTTWNNVAAEVGYDLGTALACGFNVSNDAIENGNWNGILMLTVITSLIQALPILFVYSKVGTVRLMPNSITETKQQCGDDHAPSHTCAALFFFLFVGSIVVSMAQALYVIFQPSAC